MKILHYRNLSNIAFDLSRGERKLGHDSSVVMVKGANPFHFNYDYLIEKNLKTVAWLMTAFDIYHIHAGDMLPKTLCHLILKLEGKKIIHHYHGSDVRSKRPPRLHAFSDVKVVHTPDLLDYVPDAEYVPQPINLDVWKPKPKMKTDGTITILHAPTDPYLKGTKYVIKAVAQLRNEGYPVKLMLMRNVPFAEMPNHYAQSDIVVDQLILGTYGRVSVEGMAMEKPVCVHVEENIESFLPFEPFMEADQTNIAEKLRILVEDTNLRKELGIKGRYFCEAVHDSVKLAEKILSLLK